MQAYMYLGTMRIEINEVSLYPRLSSAPLADPFRSICLERIFWEQVLEDIIILNKKECGMKRMFTMVVEEVSMYL